MTHTELKQKLLATGLVQESEYLNKYCTLLLSNCLSKYDSAVANYHHAIPKTYFEDNNLTPDNSPDNLFILLFKDHVLAHYYLAMAAVNCAFKYKMAYAVRFIVGQVNAVTEQVLLEQLPEVQKSYEIIAQGFSVNNPARREDVKRKISNSRRGKIYIKKDTNCIMIFPDELASYLATGWQRGRIGNWSHEQKNKIGIVYKGKNKLIAKAELATYIELGATVGHLPHNITNKGNMGKLSKDARQRQAEKRRNKIAMHNKETKKVVYIPKDDLEDYLAAGYVLGTGRPSVSCTGKLCMYKDGRKRYILPEELTKYQEMGYTHGKAKEVV